jgi:hypothetical protein
VVDVLSRFAKEARMCPRENTDPTGCCKQGGGMIYKSFRPHALISSTTNFAIDRVQRKKNTEICFLWFRVLKRDSCSKHVPLGSALLET